VIKIKEYKEKYEALKTFLKESGIDAGQTITDIRMY
jgi:hypothetical protein